MFSPQNPETKQRLQTAYSSAQNKKYKNNF